MKIVNGRGSYMQQVKSENREKVRAWFDENPKTSISDCMRGTGLTYKTVRARINELMAEKGNE
jgi:predicted HTH transcriptional regulator